MWKACSSLFITIVYLHSHYKNIHWIWNLEIVDVLLVWPARNKLDMKDISSLLSKRIVHSRNSLRISTAFCFWCLCSKLWDEFNIRPNRLNTNPKQMKQKSTFITFIENKLSFKSTVTYGEFFKIYDIYMIRFQQIRCCHRREKYIVTCLLKAGISKWGKKVTSIAWQRLNERCSRDK
jgi:hypothetical protein